MPLLIIKVATGFLFSLVHAIQFNTMQYTSGFSCACLWLQVTDANQGDKREKIYEIVQEAVHRQGNSGKLCLILSTFCFLFSTFPPLYVEQDDYTNSRNYIQLNCIQRNKGNMSFLYLCIILKGKDIFPRVFLQVFFNFSLARIGSHAHKPINH